MSIGKSGGQKLPVKDESDIDIFIFCTQLPSVQERRAAIENANAGISGMTLHETGGRFWGVCDFIQIQEHELCLMYFTVCDMDAEIETVLNGSRLDREGNYFYPTGRCAAFLSMYVLYDQSSDMQKKLGNYPRDLAEKLFDFHIRKVNDEEDFNRAVSRKDILFFHSVLESGLDHFLQALFALNFCYFPSRKRSLQFIGQFERKPMDCAQRLLRAVALGADGNTLCKAYGIWSALCRELSELGRCIF